MITIVMMMMITMIMMMKQYGIFRMTYCRAALLKMCLQTDEKVVTKSCENLHVL